MIKRYMKKGTALLMAALLTAGAFMGGCAAKDSEDKGSSAQTSVESSADSSTQDSSAESGAEEAEEEQMSKGITAAFFWISADLDPANDYNGWVLSRLGVGETLLKLNDDLMLEACLADEWENVDDLTWKFHIREGVTFTNGNPVDAQAVKASLERAVEKNDRAAEYLKIDKIQADGQELTITTTEPNAALLNNLVEPVFDIVDVSVGDEEIAQAPVCTGPYKVLDFVSEDTVNLKVNNDYWDGLAGLDFITVIQIADADARAMAVQSKQVQLTNTIDNTTVKLFTDNSEYNVSSIVSPRVNVAYMNNAEKSPLHDINLRKAISYAVNRDAYASLIGGSAAHSCYSDSTPFKNDTVEGYTYDVDKANSILDEAGYKDVDGDGLREDPNGEKMQLRYLQASDHGSADSAILAQGVQSDLLKAGVDVQIQSVENLSDYQTEGDFDFYTANDNSAPTGDPQVFLETMYTGLGTSGKKNLTGFQDDRIDEIVDRMRTTFETDQRYDLAAEATGVLIEDAANLFLTNSYINMVSLAYVKNAQQPVCDYYFITKDITVE